MRSRQEREEHDDFRRRLNKVEKDIKAIEDRSPVIHVEQVDGDVAGGGIAKIDDRWILWLAALAAVIVIAWLIRKILDLLVD